MQMAEQWGRHICSSLAEYRDLVDKEESEDTRYDVTLEFMLNPANKEYGEHVKVHGPYMDGLIMQMMLALGVPRSRAVADGLGALQVGAVCRLTASKELVEKDEDAGVWVTISKL
jgi:hypothetical protein